MPFLAIRESRRALWRTPEAERDALGVRPIDEREPEQQLVTARQVVEHARCRRRPHRERAARGQVEPDEIRDAAVGTPGRL
jgi:hypothetical protein